jgi:serine/threonine-protein kinase RsbW
MRRPVAPSERNVTDENSHITVQVPSAIPYLDLLQNVAEEAAQIAGFGEEGRMDVGLAVREGAVNAMKHAHRFDPRMAVTLVIRFDPSELTVSILDRGPGFDPASLPDPTAPENIWNTSGRGLLLIRNLVDGIEHFQRPDGGMELRLVKHRPAARHTTPHREGEL